MRAFTALLALLVAISTLCAEFSPTDLQALCVQIMAPGSDATANATNATANITDDEGLQNITFSSAFFDAEAELGLANQSLMRLSEAGLSGERASDLFETAHQWLLGQRALEEAGERGDYEFVLQKAKEIQDIEKQAFRTKDELAALEIRINSSDSGVNISEARELHREAVREFSDGRFERALELIDQSYEKISHIEAETTRAQALLDSAKKSIEVFLQENWVPIVVGAASIVFVVFIFQKQIRRFMINARIRALLIERGVLENMIKGLQKDYFDGGKINEMTYRIKTRKFSDLIRNINRQIPLLKEELKRI